MYFNLLNNHWRGRSGAKGTPTGLEEGIPEGMELGVEGCVEGPGFGDAEGRIFLRSVSF